MIRRSKARVEAWGGLTRPRQMRFEYALQLAIAHPAEMQAALEELDRFQNAETTKIERRA